MTTPRKKVARDPFAPYPSTAAEPHLIPIVFGDWSGDGHGNTVREYVFSNKGIVAWRAAFAAGCTLAGVDLKEQVTAHYEDRTIDGVDLAKLRASGFERKLSGKPDTDGAVEIDFDEFREMFFHLVGIGDASLTCTTLEHSTRRMEVHPGGYGLLGDE